MKKKASISVSENLLKMIDKLPEHPSRSSVIEDALILYFKDRKIRHRNSSDLDILNSHSQALNEEASNVLDYQSS